MFSLSEIVLIFANPILFETTFNSLPVDKILNWSKLKAFTDDKMKLVKMMIFVFDWIENNVGKGEYASFQHFLHFPQCFQKAYYSGSLKVRIVW